MEQPKRFTLPIFGNLGRSVSISQVNRPLSTSSATLPSSIENSRSLPQSTLDLTRHQSLSPYDGKLKIKPGANRMQRRASLVSLSSLLSTLPLAFPHFAPSLPASLSIQPSFSLPFLSFIFLTLHCLLFSIIVVWSWLWKIANIFKARETWRGESCILPYFICTQHNYLYLHSAYLYS